MTAFAVAIVVKVTFILLLAWVVARCLERASAALRHFVWATALLATLLVPVVSMSGVTWTVAVLPAAWMPPARDIPAAKPGPVVSESAPPGDPATAPAPAPPAQAGSMARAAASWSVGVESLIGGVWLAGVIAGMARLAFGLLWASWIASRAAPVHGRLWRNDAAAAAALLGLRGRVRLRITRRTSIPVTCGILRPALLLPLESARWDRARRQVVFLHELAHVRRRDCLVQALAQCACALYWFHPLAFMALKRLRAEQERACDDLVLSSGVAAPDYASHLHDIVRAFRSSSFPGWATLAMAEPSQLEGRVLAILDERRTRRHPSVVLKTALTLLALAAVVPLGAVQVSRVEDPAATHARPPGSEGLGSLLPVIQRAAPPALVGLPNVVAVRPDAVLSDADVPDGMYRIGDLDLASQLSFFIWSSIPDEQLLDLASRQQLSDPKVLEAQVRRMLADERSRAFVRNFFEPWLHLSNLGNVKPNPDAFPEWTPELGEALAQETALFLQDQLREDRNALDLLTAKYSFMNERVARHYGVPGVVGPEFRRVAYPDDRRAGLLGQGAVLALTSYADRTSPVVRAKWIREVLMGSPVPPPPPNVPPLRDEPPDREVTMRARVERHARNPVCASCHAQLDPLGFALENFDAIGRWRASHGESPIDASGRLADGTTFDGPAGLRSALLGRSDAIVLNIAEKLLTYAIGRRVEYYDMPAVRKIVRESAPAGHRWSSLVTAVVRSDTFQLRTGDDPAPD